MKEFGNGRPRENPSTSGTVQHVSQVRESDSDPARNRTRFAWLGGDYAQEHYLSGRNATLHKKRRSFQTYTKCLKQHFTVQGFDSTLRRVTIFPMQLPTLQGAPQLALPLEYMQAEAVAFFKEYLLTSHLGEPGSIPGGVTPGFSHVGIVPGYSAGRSVFSGISCLPGPYVPVLLRAHLTSSASALETTRLSEELLVHSLLRLLSFACANREISTGDLFILVLDSSLVHDPGFNRFISPIPSFTRVTAVALRGTASCQSLRFASSLVAGEGGGGDRPCCWSEGVRSDGMYILCSVFDLGTPLTARPAEVCLVPESVMRRNWRRIRPPNAEMLAVTSSIPLGNQGTDWIESRETRPPQIVSDWSPRDRDGVVVSLLTSHQGELGSTPLSPGFSHVGIVMDDSAVRRVFLGISRFPPLLHSGAAPYSPLLILIGSQELNQVEPGKQVEQVEPVEPVKQVEKMKKLEI
ncbi:hypothetical protein PR048_019556 [Dryococelus australis]|uniref:Uncharacterized protein n=1 Tax=Dryococelus australis TaxID=614101 RepID=A0ABQ9H3X1_9NEOP|nr:hypothetical protein PR048_019556 [Dryococelus australis]